MLVDSWMRRLRLLALALAVVGAATFSLRAQPNSQHDADVAYWLDQLAQAYTQQASHTAGYGDRIRMIAARLAGLDSPAQGVQALDQLLSDPESSFDVADACRMKGQYLWAQGDSVGAGNAFSTQMAAFDATPALKLSFTSSYASGINQFAGVLHIFGFDSAATTVTSRIIDDTSVPFQESTVQAAFLNRLTIQVETNNCALAVATVDALFARFPEFGADTGEHLRVRLMKTKCQTGTMPGAELLSRYLALFNGSGAAKFPQIVGVGTAVIDAALAMEDRATAYDTALKLLEHIDKYSPTWLGMKIPGVETVTKESLVQTERTLLSLLQGGENHGWTNASLVGYSRLINLARSAEETAYYQNQYNQAAQRLRP